MLMNAQLSDFYNANVVVVVGMALDVSLVTSTCLMVLIVYLVTFKSHTLGKYRWYLLNNFLWSYALDILLTLTKVVFLYPYTGVTFTSEVFKIDSESGSVLVMLLAGMTSFTWLSIGIWMAYRLSAVSRSLLLSFSTPKMTVRRR